MLILSITEGWETTDLPFLECFGRGEREKAAGKKSRSSWLFLFHAAQF